MAYSFNAASGKKAFYRAIYPYLNPPNGSLFLFYSIDLYKKQRSTDYGIR